MVTVGVALPQFVAGPSDLDDIRAYVARADELRLHSVWTLEQPVDRFDVLDPLVAMTVAATVPGRLGLGVAVLLAAARNPLLLARQLASIQHLSRGRVVAGLGVGEFAGVYDAAGIPFASRDARMDEVVSLLRMLFAEDEVTFAGRFLNYYGPGVRPRTEPVPLWFGAKGPRSLRRAALRGDGWIGAGSSSVDDFANHVTALRGMNRALPIAKRVYLHVSDKRAEARKKLHDFFSSFYANPDLADSVGVGGDADFCAARLREVVDAGAGLLILNSTCDWSTQLELIVDEVIPRIRR
ncbi:MAG: LLM class flavin-dependent oxidoreductase [Acidimicrobiaceae bacterium]|nr:LLM class flavin-dependent oxidoreductase [Acidimicrobiaceae bacterium]